MTNKHKCSREGARIRRLRLQARLTQEGLAHRVGVTTHTIWRLEKDAIFNPRLDTVRAIAKALGVDVLDLLSTSKPKR
jgi:transcriptional regulator with XRE-family HTH domain